jgi:predicted flap endonuclease-1-like 5' DNA nuclease
VSYLLIEILACLLIAGLIGAVIGWLLRGGCNKKIKDCEEECRMKLNSLESTYSDVDETDDYQMKFENEAKKVNKTYQEINDIEEDLIDKNDIKVENHILDIEEPEPLKGFSKPKEKIKIPTLGNIAIDDINLDKPVQDHKDKFDMDMDLETPEISKLDLHDIELNKKEQDISIDFVNPDIELKSQKTLEQEDGIKLNIPNIPDIEEPIIKKDDIKLNIPNLSIDMDEDKGKARTGFILGDNIEDNKIASPIEEKYEIEKDNNMQESYDIQEIEGIGPAYGRKLRSMGVESTLDLIELFKKNTHRIDRAAQDMRVKPEAITAWISMADLMRLPGINSQCAELLQTIGISSAIELSITNAHSIHNEMLKFNQKYPVCPEVPSAETITTWILSAKNL